MKDGDLHRPAECIMAFRRGDPTSTEALVGALLEAQMMSVLLNFLTKSGD